MMNHPTRKNPYSKNHIFVSGLYREGQQLTLSECGHRAWKNDKLRHMLVPFHSVVVQRVFQASVTVTGAHQERTILILDAVVLFRDADDSSLDDSMDFCHAAQQGTAGQLSQQPDNWSPPPPPTAPMSPARSARSPWSAT